jgi:hypothetical protein
MFRKLRLFDKLYAYHLTLSYMLHGFLDSFLCSKHEEINELNARKLPFMQAPCQMLFMDVGGC